MLFGSSPYSQLPFSSLLPDEGIVLAGVAASGSVGTLSPVTTYTAFGVSATGQVGSIASIVVGQPLVGVAAQTSIGQLGVAYWTEIPTTGTPNWQNITSS